MTTSALYALLDEADAHPVDASDARAFAYDDIEREGFEVVGPNEGHRSLRLGL